MSNLLQAVKNTICYEYSINDNTEPIHIGYGIDNNFSRCAGTSIVSICKNNLQKNFYIHILSLNLSETNKNKFKSLAKQESINIYIYEIDSLYFEKLPTQKRLPIPTYFRFLLPIILKDISQIYYIDADIICLKDLSLFFNVNLEHENKIIAAIADDKWINEQRNPALGLTNHVYFNAGVLIINVKKWNNLSITEKLMHILSNEPTKFIFLDQDALNLVLTGQIKYLPKEFNFHNNNCISANDNIALLHFVHIPKPWHLSWYYSDSINKYNKYLYKNFESLTMWGGNPFTLPKTYKEMRYHSMYLRKNKKYLGAIYWHIKYIANKITNKTN